MKYYDKWRNTGLGCPLLSPIWPPSGPFGSHLRGGGRGNLTKKKSYEEAKELRSLWSKTPRIDFRSKWAEGVRSYEGLVQAEELDNGLKLTTISRRFKVHEEIEKKVKKSLRLKKSCRRKIFIIIGLSIFCNCYNWYLTNNFPLFCKKLFYSAGGLVDSEAERCACRECRSNRGY